MAMNVVVIHPRDNVAVATARVEAGEQLHDIGDGRIVARDAIPQYHKVAIAAIAERQPVIKYGECIGIASAAISPGDHVHSHNLKPEED